MRSSEAAEHFFVAGNQLHTWNESMLATMQEEEESVRRSAQLLHVQRKTCFARAFFLPTTHEVGTASAAQVDRSHDVSPLLGAEVSEAHPKRVGQEGGLASQSVTSTNNEK